MEDSLYPAKGNRGQQAEERNREIPKHGPHEKWWVRYAKTREVIR
jgi:hypothetical protein